MSTYDNYRYSIKTRAPYGQWDTNAISERLRC